MCRLQFQIPDEGLAGNQPASPHNPKQHGEACCNASSTPLSQASGSVPTPNMQFRLPHLCLDGFDDEHFPLLTRQMSIPEDEEGRQHKRLLCQDHKGSSWNQPPGGERTRPCSQDSLESLLAEDLYEQKYGFPVENETEKLHEQDGDGHGPVWRVIRGTHVPTDYRLTRLSQKLAEVKQLYEVKYGVDLDTEEAVQYDVQGTPWLEIRGTGCPRDMRVERLEQMLENVKGLYTESYGRDVDTEYDADGTPWSVTEGTGVSRDCRVERLEQKLAEVKQLYEVKYGVEVDTEEAVQYDVQGTPWLEIRGTGCPRDMRVERLEQMLENVKGLYAESYGRDVDTEYDVDGTPWSVTEGTGVPRDCRVERLEQKLAEVKQLYEVKYGVEVDTEEAVQYDVQGTPWLEIRGTGLARDMRVERLEQMLENVKGLYAESYGRDVDTEYDADGTPWSVTEGTGVPRDCRVERLEQKLAEVKQLYEVKYGVEVDTEEAVQYDVQGTPWLEIRGTGLPRDMRVERLEQMLENVKGLYAESYGRDVDTEYDADGTPWSVTEGTGVPRDCRVERLEQKLAEVKQLYEVKYGVEVDTEEAVQYDAQGTPWLEIRGTGRPRDMRVERLEQMLENVKGLYTESYGRDVDTEYDADGTPWSVTEGTGVPRDCRVERLEQKLAEVKQLYEVKYGVEVDTEEAVQYDVQGTPWLEIRGTGRPRDMRVERLEQMLENVKGLYTESYGRDVDTEYDADGTPWSVTEGTGVPRDCRVERLEQKLAEVKQLYEVKYGVEVDTEEAVQYDVQGTPWLEIRGTGCPRDMRVERLEQMLENVKGLYTESYGRDVDTEYDVDGTPWSVTEGTGVPRDCRVERLEQKLAEVKQLYEVKYGVEVDTEEAVQYDVQGTPWLEIRGTGLARDMRVERLEQMLENVKGLYAESYGRDVDTEYDADGTPWSVTEGTGVPRDCRVERLEQKLAEVKQLYEVKYGVEVDTEEAVQYDVQGTPWLEIRGTGLPRDMRVERLEQMLENVKGLYAESYGRDVDTEYDADGTPWSVTEGTGVPRDCRVERLEQKLIEVNLLFAARYGQSALTSQSDLFLQGGDFACDEDGTLWIKSVTTGRLGHTEVPSEGTLSDMLTQVKALCNERFGAKPTEETQSSWSDEDGTPWVQVGSSSAGVATTDKDKLFEGTCSLQ
ncbi:unnamed protein product [Symbiodinium sp. CCMP2592]|nr:unnamed protein product [Symbiodinium sp. CCMP2592]